jgi:hypothetical protein
VDDFTAIDMDEAEAVHAVIAEYLERAVKEAYASIKRAKDDPARWEDCIYTISEVHGEECAAARRAMIHESTKEPCKPTNHS